MSLYTFLFFSPENVEVQHFYKSIPILQFLNKILLLEFLQWNLYSA